MPRTYRLTVALADRLRKQVKRENRRRSKLSAAVTATQVVEHAIAVELDRRERGSWSR